MTFPGFHDWICWRFVCLSKLLCARTLWMTRNTCGVISHASPFRASHELADVTIKIVNITLTRGSEMPQKAGCTGSNKV